MKVENTSIRLNEIMKKRNLRQVDLIELLKPFCNKYNVKINKSDISQYLSGKVNPGQDKLFMLGMALNINEAWLMGYDVSMEKENSTNIIFDTDDIKLLNIIKDLNADGKQKVLDYTKDLLDNPRYSNKIIDINKNELWDQEGKEYLMPIAAHDKSGTFEDDDFNHDNELMTNDDLWK